MNDNRKIVYLMRGLPACGKSHAARRLCTSCGVVLETDQFFYTQVGHDPASFDYDAGRLEEARQWNLNRFRQAIAQGVSPIVVDRGNGLNLETKAYAEYAVQHGYEVELREPDSPWWQELRVLLKYKNQVSPELLDQYAVALAERSRQTHRVPVETIRRWMAAWRHDVTVEMILNQND